MNEETYVKILDMLLNPSSRSLAKELIAVLRRDDPTVDIAIAVLEMEASNKNTDIVTQGYVFHQMDEYRGGCLEHLHLFPWADMKLPGITTLDLCVKLSYFNLFKFTDEKRRPLLLALRRLVGMGCGVSHILSEMKKFDAMVSPNGILLLNGTYDFRKEDFDDC